MYAMFAQAASQVQSAKSTINSFVDFLAMNPFAWPMTLDMLFNLSQQEPSDLDCAPRVSAVGDDSFHLQFPAPSAKRRCVGHLTSAIKPREIRRLADQDHTRALFTEIFQELERAAFDSPSYVGPPCF